MEPYIRIENVTKIIHRQTVLKQITLHLNAGKIYGFRGRNGSGKTMLFRAIAGFIRPTEGKVIVNGQEIGKDSSFPKNVGLLIENPGFIPEYSGKRNLEILALIKNKIGESEISSVIRQVGLDPNDKRKYKKYSLGMKQRLGIAQAIMEDPELIILDEPTNALDEEGVNAINTMLLELKKREKTILVASHDRESLDQISDEIFEIDAGQIINHEVNSSGIKA